MIFGAQNLKLGANKGLEVINERELALKVSSKFTLGAGGLDADLTQTWTFAADKLQVSSDGSGANDPVRYSQFAAFSQGLRIKANVRVATAAGLPTFTPSGSVLTMDAVGILTVDGVNLVLNDRLIVKDEAGGVARYNGFYYVSTEGTAGVAAVLTRSTDADTATELKEGSFAYVEEGTTNNGERWAVTVGPATLNTDDVTFQEIPAQLATAGAGLTMTGTTLDIVAADDSMTINANSIQVKLDAAGAISVDAGDGLQVNVDDTGIEINTNALRLKDGGVVAAKIGTAAVESAKIKKMRRFERLVGVAANGATLTLARAALSDRYEGIQVTEDNAFIDYVAAGPNESPSKEFTMGSTTTITLGYTQIEAAVYRVWYDSEAA